MRFSGQKALSGNDIVQLSYGNSVAIPTADFIFCLHQMSSFNNELKQNLQEFSQELALSPTPANICTKNFHERNRYDENDSEVRDWVSLSENTLNIELLINAAKSAKAGAVSTFMGTTRDNFEDKEVTYLEYEAYPEMALESMLSICKEIRLRWPVNKIIMQHKLGPCPVLETSIIIVISSPHRKDSLAAVHFAIDELKRVVPIWKKEYYSSGDGTWKSNQNP